MGYTVRSGMRLLAVYSYKSFYHMKYKVGDLVHVHKFFYNAEHFVKLNSYRPRSTKLSHLSDSTVPVTHVLSNGYLLQGGMGMIFPESLLNQEDLVMWAPTTYRYDADGRYIAVCSPMRDDPIRMVRKPIDPTKYDYKVVKERAPEPTEASITFNTTAKEIFEVLMRDYPSLGKKEAYPNKIPYSPQMDSIEERVQFTEDFFGKNTFCKEVHIQKKLDILKENMKFINFLELGVQALDETSNRPYFGGHLVDAYIYLLAEYSGIDKEDLNWFIFDNDFGNNHLTMNGEVVTGLDGLIRATQ